MVLVVGWPLLTFFVVPALAGWTLMTINGSTTHAAHAAHHATRRVSVEGRFVLGSMRMLVYVVLVSRISGMMGPV